MVRREALNWLKEAIADYKRAERAFEDEDWALAAFMSQQACEKSFKAVYIGILRVRPPRGHDLVMLYRGLSKVLNFNEEIAGRIPEASQYYTVARYPNAGLEFLGKAFLRSRLEEPLKLLRRL